MKKCPDCAESVQNDAKVCRYCGHKFGPSNYRPQYAKSDANVGSPGLALGCVGLLVVFAVIGSLTGSGHKDQPATSSSTSSEPSKPSTPENAYADTTKQYAWIAAGKDAIRQQLKDPDSAKFRNVHFYSGGGIPVTCGEVNARNGFGGYSGFERFVAAGDVISATESQVEGGLGPVWNKYCVRAPTDDA